MIDLSQLDIFSVGLMCVALGEHDKGNKLNRDLSMIFEEELLIQQKKVVTLSPRKTIGIRWADYTTKDLESTQREFFIFAAAFERSNAQTAALSDRIAGEIARVLWFKRTVETARAKIDALKTQGLRARSGSR